MAFRKWGPVAAGAAAVLVGVAVAILVFRDNPPEQPPSYAAKPAARAQEEVEAGDDQIATTGESPKLEESARPAPSPVVDAARVAAAGGENLQNWMPRAERDITPAQAKHIARILEDALARCGLDRVDSLTQTRVISMEIPNHPKSIEWKAYESYSEPGWTRRETYSGGAAGLIEVVANGMVMQRSAEEDVGDDGGEELLSDLPFSDVEITHDPWYSHVNHPLMLHNEYNPNIYAGVEERTITTEEAEELGAAAVAGHRLAILRSPRTPTPKSEQGIQFETWLDRDTGFVVKHKTYMDGALIIESGNYEYSEIKDGVFCPVSFEQTMMTAGGVTAKVMLRDIRVNQGVDKEALWTFRGH